jgi:hypothetical protein
MSPSTSSRPRPSHPLLDALWDDYAARVPYVATFQDLCGGAFENDHIALRTVAVDGAGSGLATFVPVFERLGWVVKDHYVFEDVHLSALYLSQAGLPRVFVSELDVSALPSSAATFLRTQPTPPPAPSSTSALAAWFSAPAQVSRAAVHEVARVSQYGAWCLCFGRLVNHFTALVDDVGLWQERLAGASVPMKAEIEGAPVPVGGIGLRQTATAAAMATVTFDDGSTEQRPYAYFEIAERHGGFDGFLSGQARQLFDQTAIR